MKHKKSRQAVASDIVFVYQLLGELPACEAVVSINVDTGLQFRGGSGVRQGTFSMKVDTMFVDEDTGIVQLKEWAAVGAGVDPRDGQELFELVLVCTREVAKRKPLPLEERVAELEKLQSSSSSTESELMRRVRQLEEKAR